MRFRVRTEMRRVCKQYNIRLYLFYMRTCHPSGIPVVGEFNQANHFWIILGRMKGVSMRIVYWTFLHELSHYIQCSEDTASFNNVSVSGSDRQELEVDAWYRAARMAEQSPFPPDDEFFIFARKCLATYGVTLR